MNLQMIDLLEKILSPSPEYDLQLLKQAGFITEARFSLPLANRIPSCGLQLSELCQHFNTLYNSSCYREIHTLCLYLMEAIDFPLPPFYMQLPTSPVVLRVYLHELIAYLNHLSTDR